jgi:hypothetical protein
MLAPEEHMTSREFSYYSYYGGEGADGPVRRRIAELAEIVSSDCDPPLEASYVRELIQALVNSIRDRAAAGWQPAPRESETRVKTASLKEDLDFEPHCAGAASATEPSRRPEIDAGPCVIGFEDAQRVLQEIRNERVRGGGPHEDLQRALG